MQSFECEGPAIPGSFLLLYRRLHGRLNRLLRWLLRRRLRRLRWFLGSRFPGRFVLVRHALRNKRLARSAREFLIFGAELAGLHLFLMRDRECRRIEKHGREQAAHEYALQHDWLPSTQSRRPRSIMA